MATDRRSGGIERVLAKCQSCVEAGNYYEAHQMYRTLYFRHDRHYFLVFDVNFIHVVERFPNRFSLSVYITLMIRMIQYKRS